ncbi:MAG: SPFH domain-containing protein [Patescibacteria group bacterium]
MAIHQLVDAGQIILANFWKFFTAAPNVVVVLDANSPQWGWQAVSDDMATMSVADLWRYRDSLAVRQEGNARRLIALGIVAEGAPGWNEKRRLQAEQNTIGGALQAFEAALDLAEARETGDLESLPRYVTRTAAWSLFLGPKVPWIGTRFVLAVDLSVQSPDPKAFDMKAADGVDIELDTRYTYRVADPVKFAVRQRDPDRDQWSIAMELLNELLRGHLNELTSGTVHLMINELGQAQPTEQDIPATSVVLSKLSKDQLRAMSSTVMADVNRFVHRFGLELLEFAIEQVTADPKVAKELADQRAAEVGIVTAQHRAEAARHEAAGLRARRDAIQGATPAEAVILTGDGASAGLMNLMEAAGLGARRGGGGQRNQPGGGRAGTQVTRRRGRPDQAADTAEEDDNPDD